MPDSDLSASVPLPDGELICPPETIFDAKAVRERIAQAAANCEDNSAVRAEAVRVLRDVQKSGRAAIAEAFAQQPFAARPLTRAYTYLSVDASILIW